MQFPEDAGPRAHPVRPESYLEMNNFYTITVYEKGGEVIQMMEQMAGRDAFIAGVRHYLDKHDGQRSPSRISSSPSRRQPDWISPSSGTGTPLPERPG